MHPPDFDSLQVGDSFPSLTPPAIKRQLRQFGLRFTGTAALGHIVSYTGKVVEKFEAEGERRVKLELQTANQYGEVRTVGDAVVAL